MASSISDSYDPGPAEDATTYTVPTAGTISNVMFMSGELGKLFAALAKAQSKFGDVTRTLKANLGKYAYSYAPLDEVLEAVLPALSENGLALMQFPSFDPARRLVTVRTLLGHESGAYIQSDLAMPCAAGVPQDVGIVTTYARRYSLQAVVAVAPDTDSDGVKPGHVAPPQPATRRSEQAEPKKLTETGTITEVKDGTDGAIRFTLSTGFRCATKDPEVVTAVRAFMAIPNARVEVTFKPSADPARFLPVAEVVALKMEKAGA